MLGCPRVMVNQGTLAPEVRQAAIDTLKTMNAYGKAKKVSSPWKTAMTEPDEAAGGAGAAATLPRLPSGVLPRETLAAPPALAAPGRWWSK